ncbi:MAG TPA: glycerol-3-phosphate dehydrogenase/oxidase [Thermoanaerobaculia bacterium]|nr:glycerol-3-phosphate dehydrogenase/oxidase [Thermoanaerobaculia bacterium]
MDRTATLHRVDDERDPWDVLVVGGGATGLGVAVDAAARGYRTLLLEQSDFAKGTSSRSTKLIHGGVRYLRQGNVSLVLEALRERGILRRNAPHLVHDVPFVVPSYDWWESPFYGIGLRLYDLLAGKEGFGASRSLSKGETLERLPTIEAEGLRGGVLYYDGQFDDARLAICLAMTAADLGAAVLNHTAVTGLVKEDGLVRGVEARDVETGRDRVLRAKVVVNATGPWTDALRRFDDAAAAPLIRPSQGVHIVLDRRFHPGDAAIMVPHTDDGRVLFAIPWHQRVVVGTTDTPIAEATLEPRPLRQELEFLLVHAARYLKEDPRPEDVLSTFAGIRPLVGNAAEERSAAISRDHTLLVSDSGLVTITGGKWTTYRKMAQDTVDHAAVLAELPERPCPTESLRLHGYDGESERWGSLALYGTDAGPIQSLAHSSRSLGAPLHPRLPYLGAEVVWAAREEMARTVEDVLARRTRALLLDARASIEAAPRVAEILAAELGRDEDWSREQVHAYDQLARGYLIAPTVMDEPMRPTP